MGTICGPNHANIFMEIFEKTYIYPYINLFSKFFCRFIDDIFFLWNGTVIQLQEFIKKLNLSYCKPTDRINLLRYTSAHRKSLTKSIPYGQTLRLKKICSETSELSFIKESFINRGFNEKFLETELQQLLEIERDALLAPKSKAKDQKQIPFIITYNKTLPNVKQMINKHRHLLQINSNLRTTFEQETIIA